MRSELDLTSTIKVTATMKFCTSLNLQQVDSCPLSWHGSAATADSLDN